MIRRIWPPLLLPILLLLPSLASAQGISLIGTVRNPTLAPVPGALVSVPALGASAVANHAGVYRVALPEEARGRRETVHVRSIGYRPQTVPFTFAAGVNRLDVTLVEQAIPLDEVLVTGTAGSGERRAQGAGVAVIEAASLVPTAPVSNLQEILQGRIPGMNITPSSGSSGQAQRIRIRGASSISLSNEPLVFIDGVRADSRNQGHTVGGQALSRLFDLNPDDIERIEVLKGPAAATLYGADATTGVIQIITKRGRAGVERFSQSLTVGYEHIAPNWTPPSNFARCRAADVAPDSPNPLCRGLAVDAIIEDNPLLREGVLRDGQLQSVNWSAQGGGSQYGYYLSLGRDDERGTLPQNGFERLSGRVAFNFAPRPDLTFDAGLGLMRTLTGVPQNQDNPTGFLIALLGSPLTVGGPNNGWLLPYQSGEGIGAVEQLNRVLRATPTLQVRHAPARWFSHRLTLGADLSHGEARHLYPRNDLRWYGPFFDRGFVDERRFQYEIYTLDYLANLHAEHGSQGRWTSDLSLGLQVTDTRNDQLRAIGMGLVTNSARAVSSAAERTGAQSYTQERAGGVLGQWQLGYRNRLFLQAGARVDRNSSFGPDADAFLLPKFGLSYVVSDEPWWQRRVGFIETLRLRGAFGTTGRSPLAGSALETYGAAVYIAAPGQVAQGVIPRSPGNPNLRPERGTEVEGGFDAGLFGDRLGVQVTLSEKRTRDLLLRRPLPPSIGFPQDAFVNIGEVRNRSAEVTLRARIVNAAGLAWEAQLAASTLSNELVSLGGVGPFGMPFRFVEGRPLGAFFSRRVLRVEVENDRAIVSDTAEYVGNPLPRFSGSFATSASFLQRVRLSGLWEWKTGYQLHNFTHDIRERVEGNAERRVKMDELPPAERLRRFGPYVSESGQPVAANPWEIPEPYMEDADFLRWRELALTYTLSPRLAGHIGATGASLTLAGRNLVLWTRYGADPEVATYVGYGDGSQFLQVDFLTMPQPRRWVARVNLQF